MLPKGLTGPINFNPQMLPREWPEEFFTGLNLLRDTLSREVEAGCRPVIAWYLAQAVGCARRIFGDPRLAVHSKVRVPSVPIPDVGLVGGTLDFLTADVEGVAPMRIFQVFPVAYSARILHGRGRRATCEHRCREAEIYHCRGQTVFDVKGLFERGRAYWAAEVSCNPNVHFLSLDAIPLLLYHCISC
jgi:hypothetical protein